MYHIVENFCGIQFGGQPLPFRGFNFHGCAHSRPLCTVQSNLFHGFNFRSQVIICENHENWTPHNFPAIRYIHVSMLYVYMHACI